MKHTLKGWLADNAVTADNKTDKILLLETAGSMNLDDILEEMYETNTGLQRETLRHVVELYHRIVKNAVLRGVQVNTGLFYAVAKFLGVIEGGGEMGPGEKFRLHRPHPRQGVARGDRRDRRLDSRRESKRDVHPRNRRPQERPQRRQRDGGQELLRAWCDAQSHGRRPGGGSNSHRQQRHRDEERRR